MIAVLYYEMIEKVKKYINDNNLIKGDEHIVLGVSGGPDSVCLLHVMMAVCKDVSRLHVIHVHHGLRESADRDEIFVKELCMKNEVDIQVVHVDVKKYASENNLSEEEAGRILRYEAFDKKANVLRENGHDVKIAVAHNMNDNAETILLNIFRGSGIRGIAGIKNKRDNIIRPLLNIERNEIEQYLKDNNIGYCLDETNDTDDYSRNRIRHNILPVAVDGVNKGAIKNMARLSEHATEALDYIDSETEKAYRKYSVNKNGNILIKNEVLEECHSYIVKAVIYRCFGEVSKSLKDVESVHIDLIVDFFHKQTGRKLDLPYDVCAVKSYEGIVISKNQTIHKNEQVQITFPCEKKYGKYKISCVIEANDKCAYPREKYTKWFDYDKIKGTLMLRERGDDDYICISSTGTKSLSKFFVDEKVPQLERDDIPIIAMGNEILWIIGYRDSFRYRIDDSTKNILKIHVEEAL